MKSTNIDTLKDAMPAVKAYEKFIKAQTETDYLKMGKLFNKWSYENSDVPYMAVSGNHKGNDNIPAWGYCSQHKWSHKFHLTITFRSDGNIEICLRDNDQHPEGKKFIAKKVYINTITC